MGKLFTVTPPLRKLNAAISQRWSRPLHILQANVSWASKSLQAKNSQPFRTLVVMFTQDLDVRVSFLATRRARRETFWGTSRNSQATSNQSRSPSREWTVPAVGCGNIVARAFDTVPGSRYGRADSTESFSRIA